MTQALTVPPARPALRIIKPPQQTDLHKRPIRITLLLNTYLDAIENSNAGDERGDKPDSRLLTHNPDLWPHGSYAELDKALDQLREQSKRWTQNGHYRGVYDSTYAIHVNRSRRHYDRRKHQAERGIAWLERHMPENIYVPQEVSENAGYIELAKAYSKPRRARAA